MNQEEIDRMMGKKPEHDMTVEDLRDYAKSSCKKCFGKGYQRFVNANGGFLRNDICMCVWKGKKVDEFMKRVHSKKNDKEAENE